MLIVLANTKGGVGKSTLAVHLATWLFDAGFQTALLDTDKQRSSSQWIAEVEPKITAAVADTPETCLKNAQELLRSHDFVVGDGPAGLDDVSRTLLILGGLAILPITPSILDLRSLSQATDVLRYAQGINGGRPDGRLVLNKMKSRDTISWEVKDAAKRFQVPTARTVIRDLQAYRDAAQQGSVVSRMGRRGAAAAAAADTDSLFTELLAGRLRKRKPHGEPKDNKRGEKKRVGNG